MRASFLAACAAIAASSTPAAAQQPAAAPAPAPAGTTTTVDFGEEDDGALGDAFTAPPPDIAHPSLIKGKYRGVTDPTADGQLEDPLAARAITAPERRLWLGARLAGGMFDDGAASARPGLALALAARLRVSRAAFVATRADWSRRGGEAMQPIDVLGASAGIGATIIGASRSHTGFALAVIGQLRADLRFADARAASPVRHAGLGIAGDIELVLPRTPFTAGLRFEQGLTDLVAGARDRAILIELGIDLR